MVKCMVKYRVTPSVELKSVGDGLGLGVGLEFQIRSSVKKVVRLKL